MDACIPILDMIHTVMIASTMVPWMDSHNRFGITLVNFIFGKIKSVPYVTFCGTAFSFHIFYIIVPEIFKNTNNSMKHLPHVIGTVSQEFFTRFFHRCPSVLIRGTVLYEDLNLNEFSRCYSAMKETCRCRLPRGVWTHWWSLHTGIHGKFALIKTHRCRLHRRVQTPRCSLHQQVISPTFKACQCS